MHVLIFIQAKIFVASALDAIIQGRTLHIRLHIMIYLFCLAMFQTIRILRRRLTVFSFPGLFFSQNGKRTFSIHD